MKLIKRIWPYFLSARKLLTTLIKKIITWSMKFNFKRLVFWCWKLKNCLSCYFTKHLNIFQHRTFSHLKSDFTERIDPSSFLTTVVHNLRADKNNSHDSIVFAISSKRYTNLVSWKFNFESNRWEKFKFRLVNMYWIMF